MWKSHHLSARMHDAHVLAVVDYHLVPRAELPTLTIMDNPHNKEMIAWCDHHWRNLMCSPKSMTCTSSTPYYCHALLVWLLRLLLLMISLLGRCYPFPI
ncbi:hypothetical protein GLYMA_09G261500v4 [Glycine max]|uniref:Uncharacterized protein n=1 Tax=Glycine max TaxID=3847 RepID=A0A0R0IJ83_SOYBN|nr:hypothetical protein GYH30_026228 [Glycine max]KRH40489.1 hypothetical protein GLYMA_09G261500v4 [Glycine max]